MQKSKMSFEYFYPLNMKFNADCQKIYAGIPFTPAYLELW